MLTAVVVAVCAVNLFCAVANVRAAAHNHVRSKQNLKVALDCVEVAQHMLHHKPTAAPTHRLPGGLA